ncbi:MAG: Rne/Rng family ribonuclease [Acidimicrobiales bacterium]
MDNSGSAQPTGAGIPSHNPSSHGQDRDGQAAESAGQSGPKKRRRGSRGGRNHKKPQGEQTGRPDAAGAGRNPQELPDPPAEGRISDPAVAERALVRKPQIGDTRPAPAKPAEAKKPESKKNGSGDGGKQGDGKGRRRRRGGRGRSRQGEGGGGAPQRQGRTQEEIEAEIIERRRGRERDGRPLGRYLMCVQVREGVTQVAVLEGRALIEHYVSRPADDVSQIHGNIYLGRVQNVLPGMEAAFVDIATPKNAVLYRGDVQYDKEDLDTPAGEARIEHILRAKQNILCQVTKNPIGAKGARLTQEVSLPGRFVVLVPNSKTYGISKRLPDAERRRLRSVLDRVKPAEHGVIVRTAAEHATEHELKADMLRLLDEWGKVEEAAKAATGPSLLHREPDMAVRVIREEFNADYRGVVIDDRELFEEVRNYVADFNPELADRVTFYDRDAEELSLFEHHHVHEQVHKALDRKVWLPSGGSLIIEHTEALTVIDVNTGKNVGKSNLEDTVFQNNLEAADEIARQLRLRDIGGIIVIDFIDMEIKDNRRKVVDSFRQALSRDKTRTQVFDISELGLVEMTRKRIGEGLLTEFAGTCPECEGRGVKVDFGLLD